MNVGWFSGGAGTRASLSSYEKSILSYKEIHDTEVLSLEEKSIERIFIG